MTKQRTINDDLYELFKERAAAVGAEVYRAPTTAEARVLLRDAVRGVSPDLTVAVSSTLLDAAGLDDAVRDAGGRLEYTDLRVNAARADLGVSEMDVAVAETGTLGQDATAIGKRLVSMLPPIHLALVSTGRIVPGLRQALARLGGDEGTRPGYLALITGPSRTADIERVLTIGVHGPERLIIICVDDGEGEEVARGEP